MVKRRKTDNIMTKRRKTDNTMAKRRRTENTMSKRKGAKGQETMPLYCLFFDIRLLITPLLSSNCSNRRHLHLVNTTRCIDVM
jgi:hypothetical protein